MIFVIVLLLFFQFFVRFFFTILFNITLEAGKTLQLGTVQMRKGGKHCLHKLAKGHQPTQRAGSNIPVACDSVCYFLHEQYDYISLVE